MFLTRRKLGKKPRSHIWNGTDTACRMWSTGGMNQSKQWEVVQKQIGTICAMCQQAVAANSVPLNSGPMTEPKGRSSWPNRTYLNVPFAQKDQVKKLGARWDPDRRQWYAPAGCDPKKFEQWSLKACFSKSEKVFRADDRNQVEHLRSIMMV